VTRALRYFYLLLALAACASLPEIDPLLQADRGSADARIKGAGGLLSKERTEAILARLERDGRASDILERHVAIEQEIAGTPLTAGNQVTLLYDGPQTYAALFKSIEQAKDHVNLEFYIIEADEVGQRLADLLVKKRRQGVAVNLIYDSVGSIGTPPEYFDRLREAGVRVLAFNPVNPLESPKIWRINNRNHRKIVVVDGKTAFTGGINISDVYSSGSSVGSARRGSKRKDAKRPGWRDTQIQIDGPAAAEFQKLFLQSWEEGKGEPLPPSNYFPKLSQQGKHLVRVIGSSPDKPIPTIYVTLLSAITNAQTSVHITMAYFVPDRQTMDALLGAARRGVDVKMILPSYSDFWAVFHAGRAQYEELLKSGVHIYERQDALLHSKTIVIDDVWSTVGSSNLDWRSFLHNYEANATILGWEFGKEMEAMFARDLSNSERITLDEWKRRPVAARVKEWAAKIWEYWL
jgi:cardiolipin synthase